eukprot:TRINITY_DN15034_c0_g1_i1.p1 TRINITY_DN15034_c0_g1~~TRINITY_DN15034_c0_g1_i1.p1  ORF type:complete len:443 (+),score=90.37 TRINITY_DN15034_c0_g1_i1:88-1416(+)
MGFARGDLRSGSANVSAGSFSTGTGDEEAISEESSELTCASSPWRAGRPAEAEDYPLEAAAFFGLAASHRIRWGHAVNSKAELLQALRGDAHLLEADVASGRFVKLESVGQYGGVSSWGQDPVDDGVQVRTANGDPVLMAHAPLQSETDLSFEDFINEVEQHNFRAAPLPPSCGTQVQSCWSRGRCGDPDAEAADFAAQLERELTMLGSASSSAMLGSCGGSRLGSPDGRPCLLQRKGVKLDFKEFDCVEPALEHMRRRKLCENMEGHVWLNADIFAGPGALSRPLNAERFVALCADRLPEAVLSLSWGTSAISFGLREYTCEMVDKMISLCTTPLDELADSVHSKNISASPVDKRHFRGRTAQERFRHITFAVSADYVLDSAEELRRLLQSVPGSSLTIFSGFAGFSVSPSYVRDVLLAFRDHSVFLDLKLSSDASACCLQ